MKKVSVNLPVNVIADMVASKMDTNDKFAQYVINVLSENYAIDVVMDCLSNGVPVSQFEIGETLETTEDYYDSVKKDCVIIGTCVLKGFNPYAKYAKYEIEYLITVGNKQEAKTTTTTEEHLKRSAS